MTGQNKLIKEKLKQSFVFFKYRKDNWKMLAKCSSYAIEENEKNSISYRWIYYQLW